MAETPIEPEETNVERTSVERTDVESTPVEKTNVEIEASASTPEDSTPLPTPEASSITPEASSTEPGTPNLELGNVEPVPERLGAVSITVETEADRQRKEEERRRKDEERRKRDEAYAVLAGFKEANTSFDVTIQERVKGGLRGDYNGLRVFLPASHFGMRKNVGEDELTAAIGSTMTVKVHELQSDDTGFKSAVVTRRDILQDEFWQTIQPGAEFEGVVTSITPFGVFVNIGGAEGLVHVSRLSRSRIENPADVVKKGDKLKVTVVEVDREKHKLSLSHKEHEADAWVNAEQTFPVGTRLKGTVRRIADFGAYVQVAPRIEGLLRISELSWTQRIKHPSDVVSVGQEIDIEVLSTSAAKHQMSLGYKQTQPNPWSSVKETMPVGSETTGIVQQVSSQGAVVRVAETFDGFMPRSKMQMHGHGKKPGLNPGDSVQCVVVDINPESSSLILAMKGDEQHSDHQHQHQHRQHQQRGNQGPSHKQPSESSTVTLADMLREADKSKLNS